MGIRNTDKLADEVLEHKIQIGEKTIQYGGYMPEYQNSIFGKLERKYAIKLIDIAQQYANELKNIINLQTGEPLIPIKDLPEEDDSLQEILREIDFIENGVTKENYGKDTIHLIKYYLNEYIKIANMIDDLAKDEQRTNMPSETSKNIGILINEYKNKRAVCDNTRDYIEKVKDLI